MSRNTIAGYTISIQKTKSDREVMVRAGCRYMTLAAAKRHWSTRPGAIQRNFTERQRVLYEIASLLLYAESEGWTRGVPFDPVIKRRAPSKRRKAPRAKAMPHKLRGKR